MGSFIPKARRGAAVWIFGGVVLMLMPAPAHGSLLTFYTDAASFSAAAPGLPVDDFSAVNTFSQTQAVHASPVSSATNDGTFPASSILPGLTLSTTPGDSLYIEGSGSSPKLVGTYSFQDPLFVSFSAPVSAVGEEVLGNSAPGPGFAGTVTEQVYNGTTLIGSKNLSEAAGAGGYLGVTSALINITSISLLFNPTADVDAETLVSDVSFTPLPEPASFALLTAIGAPALRRWRPARR